MAAVLLMWGGTGKVMAQKNIDKMAAELEKRDDVAINSVTKRDPKTRKVVKVVKSFSLKDENIGARLIEAFEKDEEYAETAIKDMPKGRGKAQKANFTFIYIYGARYSLIIGVGSVLLGLLVGTILGSQAGFKGGITDSIIMRGIDIFYSIPNIMTAVVIVSLLGPSTVNLMIALAFSCASSFARIVRASVMTIRDQEYVESSYAMGLPTWKIIVKHILPNCLSPIIVQITLLIGTTIISASSLSFLGIGVPAPAPEWGALLSAGRSHIRDASYMCIIPGLAIMFTVLALNLLGDGLRDALDPKLKK